ncbi:hypothetical protein Anas_05161 [Armadillidium nasatum]|uniref:Uncharacterized protein n=1 Tax=Armadillidium nasatum TaxID=96803 RepID=A0A5N5SKH0_9CRUS|nr:hypothetical protein Anas_05161 [Armadillidium nasatum]
MRYMVHLIFTILFYISGTNCLNLPLISGGGNEGGVLGNVLQGGILDLELLNSLNLDQIVTDALGLITGILNLEGECLSCGNLDVTSTLVSCLKATTAATENVLVGAVASVACLFGECNGLGLLTPVDCPTEGCQDSAIEGPILSRRKRQANPLDSLFEYIDNVVCKLVNPVVASILTLILDILLSVLNL